MAQNKNVSNGAKLGFEEKMWQAADKLRNNRDAAEYKHVVLDADRVPFKLIFL
ncbi:hypothetical protein [Methanolobus sp. WCC5]|uniref:hypothetical protein n=1 Tax=Methanolobus sp. WCC5 TaxID=3125785 RepID=UPI0032536EC4